MPSRNLAQSASISQALWHRVSTTWLSLVFKVCPSNKQNRNSNRKKKSPTLIHQQESKLFFPPLPSITWVSSGRKRRNNNAELQNKCPVRTEPGPPRLEPGDRNTWAVEPKMAVVPSRIAATSHASGGSTSVSQNPPRGRSWFPRTSY